MEKDNLMIKSLTEIEMVKNYYIYLQQKMKDIKEEEASEVSKKIK